MPQKQPDRQTAARVPDAEQPYPVPKNWAWVKLKQLAEIIKGISFDKSDVQKQKTTENSLVLRGGNIQNGKIVFCEDDIYIHNSLIKPSQQLKKGDVILTSSSGSKHLIGKAAYIEEYLNNVSFGAFVTLLRTEQIQHRYFGYYFQTFLYRQTISELSSGTNINNIKRGHLENLLFPVPPLAEQRRIVATLDSLLGKLRAARDLLDAARDSFALRRAAILHKAFSGQLTAAWRKEHPDLARPEFEEYQEQPYEIPESWAWMKVDKIVNSTNSGFACAKTHEISEFESDAYPHLRPNNIGFKEKLNLEKVVFIPKDKVEPTKSFLKKGSVLFNNTNSTELVGRAVYIEEDMNYAFSNHINLIEVNIEIVLPKWFTYAINKLWTDGFFRRYSKKWVGQSGYNQEMLKHATFIPIPPIEEQREIVRRLDALLTHEAEAAALLDMDEHLDLLEQSILARAFRGELGTRDPADAPAVIG